MTRIPGNLERTTRSLRKGRALSFFAAAALGLSALIVPASASAAPGVLMSVDFLYPDGAVQYWVVPNGVYVATFYLWGAEGGTYYNNSNSASLGAQVIDTVTNLYPGEVLQVHVGGAANGTTAGTNGGGLSGGGGAGGGATDVRVDPFGDYGLGTRILVAGGGGGAAATPYTEVLPVPWDPTQGPGGNAGSDGGDSSATDLTSYYGISLGGGKGGKAATPFAGGLGGGGGAATGTPSGNCANLPATVVSGSTGADGSPGTVGVGGQGAPLGGGGGGGLYGGGGGGQGATTTCTDIGEGGGGGGGSSFAPDAGSSITNGVASPDGAPNGEAFVVYTPEPNPTTTTLTAPSSSVGCGSTVHLAATVIGSDSGGTVSFLRDGNVISPCAHVAAVLGTFRCNIAATFLGAHTFWATYGGDANSAASWSNLKLLTVKPTKPGAPTLTRATPVKGGVELSFKPPASTGGSLLAYEVFVGSASNKESTTPFGNRVFPGAPLNIFVAPLQKGHRYFFVLRARNALGLGAKSNQMSAVAGG
jgi:hypothetical protein